MSRKSRFSSTAKLCPRFGQRVLYQLSKLPGRGSSQEHIEAVISQSHLLQSKKANISNTYVLYVYSFTVKLSFKMTTFVHCIFHKIEFPGDRVWRGRCIRGQCIRGRPRPLRPTASTGLPSQKATRSTLKAIRNGHLAILSCGGKRPTGRGISISLAIK